MEFLEYCDSESLEMPSWLVLSFDNEVCRLICYHGIDFSLHLDNYLLCL